jgi:hypothetical protein
MVNAGRVSGWLSTGFTGLKPPAGVPSLELGLARSNLIPYEGRYEREPFCYATRNVLLYLVSELSRDSNTSG